MYTAALEYHIGVLQGLQKIAAYTDDMFSPEEIDLHLTKQQGRLVAEIVNKSFTDLQLGLDYIKPLIVKNKKLQVIIPGTSDSIYEPNMVYSILPPDYLHLINDRSGVVTSTAVTLCNNLSVIRASETYKTTFTEYVLVTPMVTSLATAPPYYYNFKITVTTSGTPVEYTLPAGLNNIRSSQSGFSITNYIKESLVIPGVVIYWEKYRELYYPNSFIFVTQDSNISTINFSCTKSSVDTGSGGASSSTSLPPVTYTIPAYTTISGYTQTFTGNTLIEIDEIYSQNVNEFYKSHHTSPKTGLSHQYVLIYEGKSFLVSDLVLDYVRIPRQISLSLNQISELGGDASSIIIDRTVEYLKLAIENPAYQAVLNDNKLRNQL